MFDEIFSIFEDLIIPIILIITGRVLWKHPSIDIVIRIGRKSTLCIEDEEIATQVSKETGIKEDMILENGEFMSDDMFLDFAAGFIPFSRKQPIPFEEIENGEMSKTRFQSFIFTLIIAWMMVYVSINRKRFLRKRLAFYHYF